MKKILSVIMLFHVALLCCAAGISKEKALSMARQFMQSRQDAQFVSAQLSATPLLDGSLMAVNSSESGFVLVSGSDKSQIVLGYSDHGTFSLDDAPDHIKSWLQGYADQIKDQKDFDDVNQKLAPLASIAPLITTTWNQGEPYNNNCILTFNTSSTMKCVTGCVATAMAQVINYHKHPTTALPAIPRYDPYSNAYMTALPATTLDWAHMKDNYSGSYTSTEANAVATLMRYCGQSVKMKYGSDESNAYSENIPEALISEFGFSKSTKLINRERYTIEGWRTAIYNELAANRPVIYGGQSTGGGHCFIVDGYDDDDYFHINWGWGGSNDGYFLLSILNPHNNSGIGASSTKDGYSFGQDAIIGIKPDDGTAAKGVLTVRGTGMADGYYTMTINNYTGHTYTFDYGYAAINSAGDIVKTIKRNTVDINDGGGYYMLINTDNFTDLPNGDYKVVAVSRFDGDTEWNICDGSDLYYLTLTVNGGVVSNVVKDHIAQNSDITIKSYTQTGDNLSGHPQTLDVEFANASQYDYYKEMNFYLDGNKTSTSGVVIPGEGTTTISFGYLTYTHGNHTFTLKQGDTIIGSGTITLTNSGIDTSKWYAICEVADMETIDGQNIVFSNDCAVTVTFYNPTNTKTTKSINIGRGKGGIYAFGWTKAITLEAGASKKSSYILSEIGWMDNYQWVVQDASDNRNLCPIIELVTAQGGKAVDAAGNKAYITSGSTVPANATSVDFTFIGNGVSSLNATASTNANCLYYLAEGTTAPSWLAGKNVVKGSDAETLNLTATGDFKPTKNFTAQTATFTQSFTGTNGLGGGWNTIVLPFEATSVKDGSKDIRWFNSSSDTGANFWLYGFSGESAGNLVFSHVPGTSIPANTPCIIAVPDATWGAANSLAGKALTFSATNATIKATATAVTKGTEYKMLGTYCSQTASDIYVLNAAGSKFTKQTSATAAPFTAYFASRSLGTPASLGISLGGDPLPTGISEIQTSANAASESIYNIMGQKTNLRKGLMIINGKKVVVK